MHEWALAEAVVSTALRTAKEKGFKKITKVKVKLGELQQIDVEIFKSALNEIKKQKQLEAEIVLEEEKAALKCRVCDEKWSFEDATKNLDEEREFLHFIPETAHAYLKCPKCGSPDFEITGRGVSVESVEGV